MTVSELQTRLANANAAVSVAQQQMADVVKEATALGVKSLQAKTVEGVRADIEAFLQQIEVERQKTQAEIDALTQEAETLLAGGQ